MSLGSLKSLGSLASLGFLDSLDSLPSTLMFHLRSLGPQGYRDPMVSGDQMDSRDYKIPVVPGPQGPQRSQDPCGPHPSGSKDPKDNNIPDHRDCRDRRNDKIPVVPGQMDSRDSRKC